MNQELSLLRLTIPAGARSAARAHSGPGLAYVLEGSITITGTAGPPRTYGTGDLFLEPATRGGVTFGNANSREPAKLLLYQVGVKSGER